MDSEPAQKETPGPLNRKRPRKGSRGQRCQGTQRSAFRPAGNCRSSLDVQQRANHLALCTAAGPLSADMSSLGGFVIFDEPQAKRNPGPWHRRKDGRRAPGVHGMSIHPIRSGGKHELGIF